MRFILHLALKQTLGGTIAESRAGTMTHVWTTSSFWGSTGFPSKAVGEAMLLRWITLHSHRWNASLAQAGDGSDEMSRVRRGNIIFLPGLRLAEAY